MYIYIYIYIYVYIYAYLFWHAYGAMPGICYIADYGAVYLYGKYLSIYIYIYIYIHIYFYI